MKILAFSDVHYPDYFDYLNIDTEPDIVIMAGDIIEYGNVKDFRKVVRKIRDFGYNGDILACFGNTEYDEIKEKIKEENPDVIFLEESYFLKEHEGKKIGFFGTRGILDKPTIWQMKNIPDIEKNYEEKMEKIERGLNELKNKVDHIVYFSHYAPTYKTLEGERKEIYPYLGSKKLEKIITKIKPDLVIHGHAHYGKAYDEIENIPIYNVALPLNKKPVVITLEKGLFRWIE